MGTIFSGSYGGSWEEVSELPRTASGAFKEITPGTKLRDRIARKVAGYECAPSWAFQEGIVYPGTDQSFKAYSMCMPRVDGGTMAGLIVSLTHPGFVPARGHYYIEGDLPSVFNFSVIRNEPKHPFLSRPFGCSPGDTLLYSHNIGEGFCNLRLMGTGPYEETVRKVGSSIAAKARDLRLDDLDEIPHLG
ncbi:MAG: hypothetical protein JW727_00540 [Candidatus Aenigmarchaeota archaeon]|nr:hypothetical protein [Candidatus Aenigmarchaeota archaeon]